MKSLKFLPIILCLLCADACFVSSRNGSGESSNANAAASPNSAENAKTESVEVGGKADNPIRKIDFKNFTYEPGCTFEDNKKVTVKNGEYTLNKGDDKMFFDVASVTYGDVNGDQVEDAIVLTSCNTGGTGQFSEGFIYGMKDGKTELLSNIEGGDRAYGGLRSAKVENGLLVVERNDAGENGASCCPEFVVTSKYKLEGKTLKQVGGDVRRDLYPPQRVKFEKGAQSAFVDVKLTNDEDIKRFVIGAREMQLLTVESSSKDVSITLVKGNADVMQQDGKILQATLKETGDFVIQVQKINDKNVNASINFDIR